MESKSEDTPRDSEMSDENARTLHAASARFEARMGGRYTPEFDVKPDFTLKCKDAQHAKSPLERPDFSHSAR